MATLQEIQNAGGSFTPVQNVGMTPIPNATIKNASVIKVPPTQTIDPMAAAVNASNNETVATQTDVNNSETQVNKDRATSLSLYDQLSGKTADTQALEQTQGIPELNKNLNELQNISRQKTLEYNTTPFSLQGQGRGISTNILRGQEAVKQRQLGIDIMLNNSNIQAAQGQLQLAKATVDRAISAKYDPIEAKINAYKTIIENGYKDLSRADKKLADAKNAQLDLQKQQLEEKKTMEKEMHSLSLTIAKNGAPARVQEIIKNAKDFNEAVIAAAPYLRSAEDKADLSYKVAQTAKIYADIKNDAMTAGSNVAPENMLPFAQEYASTGKIPLGAPKGSQASIMRYAKELPQAPGSLVSSITGVKNTGLGVAQQEDITRLYNITQAVKELKKLDEARIGGLAAGTVGKVFGSNAQGDYLAKRKSIVDDISRMQSGAALTESEVKFYEDYLPGRFSETLGLGRDSYKKIETFEKLMNEKLDNTLKNNQLSVYGYSKVTPPGSDTEYTVGDLVQVDGRTGRINPDGTITIVE